MNGSYNALLTQIQHRFSSTFAIDAHYTFAKAEDNASHDYATGTYPFNLRSEWGLSDYDVQHNFKLYGVRQPRIFRNAGGWTVSGILNAHTGFPWTPVFNIVGANGTACGVIFANSSYCTVRPAAYLGGAGTDYSNDAFKRAGGNFPNGPLAYFAPPTIPASGIPAAPGVARNSFRGPRYSSVDFTLGKSFGLPAMRVLGETTGHVRLRRKSGAGGRQTVQI